MIGTALGALGYPTPGLDLHDPKSITQNNYAHTVTNQVDGARTTILDGEADCFQCQLTTYIVSVPALGFIKLAFLFFLRRIFCTNVQNRTPFDITTWVLIGLVSVWTLSFFIAWFTTCGTAISAFWGSFAELKARCGNSIHILTIMSITDVVLDCLIVLLPLPMVSLQSKKNPLIRPLTKAQVWSLHLSIQKKIAVTSIFLIGLIVVAASICRLVLVLRSQNQTGGVDQDLYVTNVIWWTMFETGMALLGSCLSSLRPLFSEISTYRVVQSLRSKLSRSSVGKRSHASANDSRPTHVQKTGCSSDTSNSFELLRPSVPSNQHSVLVTKTVDVEHGSM